MNVFRTKSWTHYEPKQPKGTKREGIVSAGFKVPKGSHGVILHLGNIPEGQELSDEIILALLESNGLILSSDAQISPGSSVG